MAQRILIEVLPNKGFHCINNYSNVVWAVVHLRCCLGKSQVNKFRVWNLMNIYSFILTLLICHLINRAKILLMVIKPAPCHLTSNHYITLPCLNINQGEMIYDHNIKDKWIFNDRQIEDVVRVECPYKTETNGRWKGRYLSPWILKWCMQTKNKLKILKYQWLSWQRLWGRHKELMKSEEKLKDTALFYTDQSAQKEKSRLGNGRKTVIEKEMQSWQEITKEEGKCTWIRLKSGWKETQRNAIEQLKSNQCRNTNIHFAEKWPGGQNRLAHKKIVKSVLEIQSTLPLHSL